MNEIENQGPPEPDWSTLRPIIDSAMHDLKEGDRDALLLRFFQARTLAEVGQMLGLSENAARMRVDRALDKLHGSLVRRGIKSTATALGAVLTGQLATAAPASLAATVTTTALAGAATATGATIVFMGMTKLQTGIAAALVVAGGSVLWSENQTGSKLRAENSALVQQTEEVSALRIQAARFESEAQKVTLLRQQAAEVEVLRSEEAQLRQAALERERLMVAEIAAKQKLSDGQPFYYLKQLDAQPRPRKRVQPVYPFAMKKMGVGGEVLVEFVLKPDGTIRDIHVVKSTHEAFAEAALAAMAQWEFAPGQKGGRPVHARMQQPFVFAFDFGGIPEWF